MRNKEGYCRVAGCTTQVMTRHGVIDECPKHPVYCPGCDGPPKAPLTRNSYAPVGIMCYLHLAAGVLSYNVSNRPKKD